MKKELWVCWKFKAIFLNSYNSSLYRVSLDVQVAVYTKFFFLELEVVQLSKTQ